MDSLFNILAHKDYDLPPEVLAIKRYVHDEFASDVEVLVRDKDIVIIHPSASLIASLRLRSVPLQKVAQTKKRLSFRIG